MWIVYLDCLAVGQRMTPEQPQAPARPARAAAQVLPEDASQADVYQAAVRSIVDDVMQGFNGTVMAYGQVRPPA